jgi:RNA polymerase sigma-70 factor (ECF subfamily)
MCTDTAADTEPHLLEWASAGDHRAFVELVRSFESDLRALAFRLLLDRDRIDDALQEAFLRAFRALPRFRGDASVKTWLHRITTNVCIDELRRRRPVESLDDDDRPEPATLERDPADVAATRQDLVVCLPFGMGDLRAICAGHRA